MWWTAAIRSGFCDSDQIEFGSLGAPAAGGGAAGRRASSYALAHTCFNRWLHLPQGLVLLLCALGPEELSEVRLGPLTPHAVRTLRHIREFFNVQFK